MMKHSSWGAGQTTALGLACLFCLGMAALTVLAIIEYPVLIASLVGALLAVSWAVGRLVRWAMLLVTHDEKTWL